jgi:hypothetical protein
MAAQNLLRVGDKMFLERQEVVVTKIFAIFQLVEIYCAGVDSTCYVDASALTSDPDHMFSISIRYFGRRNDE